MARARRLAVLGLSLVMVTTKGVGAGDPAPPAPAPDEQFSAGQMLYQMTCMSCHMPAGEGQPGLVPPLAQSDYLNADIRRAIRIPLRGLTGKISVNGQAYDGVMPPVAILSNEEIASILTFVLASWGNSGARVTAADVAAVRSGAAPAAP